MPVNRPFRVETRYRTSEGRTAKWRFYAAYASLEHAQIAAEHVTFLDRRWAIEARIVESGK
jgi:hypothetical protein